MFTSWGGAMLQTTLMRYRDPHLPSSGFVLVGLICPSATLKMDRARHELIRFGVAAFEFVCWEYELRYSQMLAAAQVCTLRWSVVGAKPRCVPPS